jgi:hypothetical protein
MTNAPVVIEDAELDEAVKLKRELDRAAAEHDFAQAAVNLFHVKLCLKHNVPTGWGVDLDHKQMVPPPPPQNQHTKLPPPLIPEG